MKLEEMLDKLGEMLQPEASKKKSYHKKLKKLLKDLRKKEKKLKLKLEETEDEQKRKRLLKELEIVHSQRKKGIQALEAFIEDNADEK